jgi:hypothetical protein
MKMRVLHGCALALSSALCFSVSAQDRGADLDAANKQQMAEATGHYARARALLISAVNEFDRARKIARPDELIDPVRWRNTLIDRAEDLERVLDPQPRASTGGIQFSADPRLLSDRQK